MSDVPEQDRTLPKGESVGEHTANDNRPKVIAVIVITVVAALTLPTLLFRIFAGLMSQNPLLTSGIVVAAVFGISRFVHLAADADRQ